MCCNTQMSKGIPPNLYRHASVGASCMLSGPLNRLNAILSLLHSLDCKRTLSAIGSAVGRPYLASTHSCRNSSTASS